jgi:hypothetical protein
VLRVGIAAGFVLAYLYAFPYFRELRSANEVPRVALTEEIVDHGTFRLDAQWREISRGSTFDVATTPDGHHYSNKAPGASLAAVPAYLVLKAIGATGDRAATWAFRVTASTLPALLFLPLFLAVARRLAPEMPARAALVAVAFGSMVYPYALLFYSHALAAACAGGAFALAVARCRGSAGWGFAVATGALAGAAVLVDYQAALASLGVAGYLAWRSRRRLADLALAALGAIPPAALLALYHWACFGSPLRTGYSFAADPAHKQGVLGVIGPNAQAMAQALIAPDNGLLILAPWTILAVVGGIAVAADREARARAGAEILVCALVAAAYVLFIGSLVPEFGRAGWSVGPRYITVAVPFLGWLAAAGLAAVDRRPALRALAHGLVLAGVIIYGVAATTYPHWPTAFRNPLWDVSFRALGAGLAPHSLGTWLGLRGLASLLPLYLVVAALALGLLSGRERGRWLTSLAALLIAAGIVYGVKRFPSGAPPDKWAFIEREWEPR